LLEAYARFVTRHATAVLLLVAALTMVAITRIVDVQTGKPRLLLDPSIESLLPSADENRIFYDKTRKIFGNDDTLLLAIHRPDGVFTAPFLTALLQLTKRVGALDGVQRVMSLANAPNVRSIGGDLEVAPLYEEPPTDPAELDRVRRDALASPLFRGSLLGEDSTTAGIAIQLIDMPEMEFNQRGIDQEIQRIAREEFAGSPDVRIWLVGSAHLKAETSRFLLRDLSLVIPLAFALIMLIAVLSFRSLRGLLIPVSTIGIAVVWTFAVMAEVDPALNLVTISIPPLLLVIGFVEAVHIVACYYEAIEEGAGHASTDSAATRGLAMVVLPMFLTGSTTVAGFLSLVTSPLGAIREFGLYGGIGITFTMLVSLTFAPAVLHLLREPPPTGRQQRTTAFERWIGQLASLDYHHAGKIFIGSVILGVIALLGIPRILINSTMISNFGSDTEIRRAVEAVNQHLGASGQLQVVLETDYVDAFKEPENLRVIEELQKSLATLPDVTGTTSVVDYVKLIYRGFNANDEAFYRIPESRRLTTQLLFFGSSDDVAGFVNSQYQLANIRVRTTALDSANLSGLVRSIEARLAELPARIHGRVTGNLVLLAKTNDEIAFGQAVSVGSAFTSIFAIMALQFMSFRVGFIAMIPNVLPVLFYFGILGWTGISLNVTTGLVASIVLGIAVDDTIHFLGHFNVSAKRTASEKEGVRLALMHVGRPVTYATAALCLGFLALSLSSLRQQAEFGVLAAVTLFLGWCCDLTFTPAIASRIRIVTLWDVLTLDLGANPQLAIPLFKGMSKAQARIVALMTQIVEAKAGQRLIQMGDKSDGMYVVIEGKLRSSVESDGHSVPLNTHGRGDVLGEVGLFRGERTANVDCETDTRLLRLDQQNLTRLRRRYPRTSAHLFRNLSDVLAGRLAAVTTRLH
jgi:predicted RND superfamily exporter protein